MKILLLNTHLGYDGASKMMAWLSNILVNRGHDVTFITYRNGDVLQPLSTKIHHIHLNLEGNSQNKMSIFRSAYVLRKFIKQENFSLAIAFLSPSYLRLSLATVGLKIKLLYSQRGDPYQKPRGFHFGILISEIAFKHADMYVFQTDAAKNYYSEKIRYRSKVICNPITPINLPKRDRARIESRIVNIARLDIKQKRQDLLIEAFNLISSDYPDVVLELYGDGPDLNLLKHLASGNNNIIFKGKTLDVNKALKNARLFVLSSDFEGIPNALLESMSAGIPSISTDCSPGGAAMLINSYENGILVPRNNANDLANAIKYMLNNISDAEKMGENAKYVNNLYSEDSIAHKWIKFIENHKLHKDS